MASYYTYGAVPTVEETVFGPLSSGYADGGFAQDSEDRFYTPREDSAPLSPPASPLETPAGPTAPLGEDATDWFKRQEQAVGEFMDTLSPEDRQALLNANLAGFAGAGPISFGAGLDGLPAYDLSPENLFIGGTGGADLETGSLYDDPGGQAFWKMLAGERGLELQKQLNEYVNAKVGTMPGGEEVNKAFAPVLEQRKAADDAKKQQYLATLPQRRELSNLLKQNKFAEAFSYASQTGLTNLISNPAELKNLRGAFTKDELLSFYQSIPENLRSTFAPSGLQGGGFQFSPEAGVEYSTSQWKGETGFPLASAAYSAKEDKTIKNAVKVLGALALASAAPAIFGSTGAASGATASGAAGATGAAGAGAAGAGAAGAGSGLAEVVVTAKKVSDAAKLAQAAGALGGGSALAKTATQGVTSAGQPTVAQTTSQLPMDGLEEVVVQAAKRQPYSLLGPGTLASTSLMTPGSMSDIPTDIYGRVQGEPDLTEGKLDAAEAEVPKEPFQDRLDEVIVTGSKYKPGIIDLGAIGAGGLTAAQLMQGFTEPTLRPYEELPPEGEPIEEVVVTGSKPTPIDLMGVGIGGLTAAQLMQGFTQPKVDPFTGEPKEPPKTEQELDKIQAALKAGTTIPGTSSFLKDLISKYGTLENALKLLGALGAGAAKGPKMPTGGAGAGTGGMGGALPKYTYTRQQLSPDIDYYTYGTRPEARFFEQGLKLEQPTQPEPPQGPPSKPPEEEPVFATGGLTGYAKGGSKSSRYVDGPGSGRDDKIPALLSDGEYVIDAETLALLGDGSTKEGARRMDKFRANIRKHKGRALSRGRISPNAKSPSKYMGGGLT